MRFRRRQCARQRGLGFLEGSVVDQQAGALSLQTAVEVALVGGGTVVQKGLQATELISRDGLSTLCARL